MRWFLVLVGVGLCGFGALFIIGGVANLVDTPEGQSAWTFLLATLFLGLAPLGAGGWLFWYARQQARRASKESQERLILELARQRGGQLTVAEVARSTALSSTQAKQLLDQCHLDQLANLSVSASDAVTYTFDGIGHAPQR